MRSFLALFLLLLTHPLNATNINPLYGKIFKVIKKKEIKKLAELLSSEEFDSSLLNTVSETSFSSTGLTPLLYAVKLNRNLLITLLLKSGANPNTLGKTDLILKKITALAKKVDSTGLSGMKLTSNDLDNDKSDFENENVALHLAVMNKNPAIISSLLSYDADPNIFDYKGRTPLFLAIEKNLENSLEIVRLLIAGLADPNKYCGKKNPLILAIKKNDIELINLLLENGADPNIYCNRETPLTLAIKKRDIELINLLLENSADPDLKNDAGLAPLHLIADMADKAFLQAATLLLSHGADINAKDDLNSTPLCYAANRNVKTIDILVLNGADLGIDSTGCKRKFSRIAKLMTDIGQVETYESRVRMVLSDDDLFIPLFVDLTIEIELSELIETPIFPGEIWSMIIRSLPLKDARALGLLSKYFIGVFFLDDLKHQLDNLPTYQLTAFLRSFAPEHLPEINAF